MSWKALCSQIDPACLKKDFTKEEYTRVKSDSIRVNSTDLYKEYGMGMTYQAFYNKLKECLYYDRLICTHGIEFYYYIKFKKPRPEVIREDDVIYTINAIGGYNV